MNKMNVLAEKWASMDPAVLMPPMSPSAQQLALPRTARMALQYRRRPIPTRTLVNAAIKSQMRGPRDGVSFVAIKKYIARNYEPARVDLGTRLRFIKRYILSALESGKLVRTRGTGVCGSFRLPLRSTLRRSMKRSKKKRTTPKKIRVIKKELEKRLKAPAAAAAAAPGGSGDGKQQQQHQQQQQQQQLVKTVSKASLRRTNRSAYDLTAN